MSSIEYFDNKNGQMTENQCGYFIRLVSIEATFCEETFETKT